MPALVLVSSTSLASDSEGHEFKHHAPGIFLGSSDKRGGGDELSIGFEYEYRFNPTWGAGVVYEHTPDAHDSDGVSVFIANAYVHPYAGWRFGLGAGREKVHGGSSHYDWVYRVGAAYDFHVGQFAIVPSLSLDMADGGDNVLVYGVGLLWPF